MARRKVKRRGRPAKKTMDERLKEALAEAKRLKKVREDIATADSKLSDLLSELADEMREIESEHDEDRITSDDLDNAAIAAEDNYSGEPDYDSIICYLEGKHGC